MISYTIKSFAYFVPASISLFIFTLMTASDAHAQGGIRADSLTYNTPRTHYYSVGPGDFISTQSDRDFDSFNSPGTYFTVAGRGVLQAGLHLPDGAVITKLRAYVYDFDLLEDLEVSIVRHGPPNFIIVQTLARVDSLGIPTVMDYTDTTIDHEVIDNQNFMYRILVRCDDWPGDTSLYFRGAFVTYTIAEAD